MSSKFGLALLLLCFVLLGLSEAQRLQHQKPQKPQQHQQLQKKPAAVRRLEPRQHLRGRSTSTVCKTTPAPEIVDIPTEGINREENELAANIKDTRRPH